MEYKRTVTGVCSYCGKLAPHRWIGADCYRCKRCKRVLKLKDFLTPKEPSVKQKRLFP